jgi:tetratricopeptide (TPR) repeat protein
MQSTSRYLFLTLFLFLNSYAPVFSNETMRIKTIYFRLPQTSIQQQLAFYHLYPDTKPGQLALQQSLKLLKIQESGSSIDTLELSKNLISGFINFLYPFSNASCDFSSFAKLPPSLGSQLNNRNLKGYYATTVKEVLDLPDEEIDIAKAVFLASLGDSSFAKENIKQLEALLDVMALQVIATLPANPSTKDKINSINKLIYFDIGFRYPPIEQGFEFIDRYSFLSSVMDYRQGVCLGTSLLLQAIAQRIELPLEVITPPGHIYLRHISPETIINIETTLRGVNLPTKNYLSIDTKQLQPRTLKETAGLSFVNQGLLFFQHQRYNEAQLAFEKALPFLKKDPIIHSLLGLTHYMKDNWDLAKNFLEKSLELPNSYRISEDSLSIDVLNGKASQEAIRAIFLMSTPDIASLTEKKKALEEAVEKTPHFREALFHLAVSWLQLQRPSEALQVFEKLYKIDDNDIKTCYYLSSLYLHKSNLPKSYSFLLKAEEIASKNNASPPPLELIRKQLNIIYPR